MKLTHILTSSALLSSMLFAGGDIIPVKPIVENMHIEERGTRGQKGYFAYAVTTYGPIIGLNFKF